MRVPDYVEPTVGYRMWNVSQLDGLWYLSSIANVGVLWPTNGPLHAVHHGDEAKWLALNIFHMSEAGSELNPPTVPVKGCSCGIYAYASPERMFTSAEGVLFRRVIGEVKMWGKVWEHEDGYRAEYARPSALWAVRRGMGLPAVHALAARYDVPVVTFPS